MIKKTLNSVFVQPTYGCALFCKACYVQGSVKGKQLSVDSLSSLIRFLFVTDRYNIKQITIAVDNLPREDSESSKIMQGVLREAIRMRTTGTWASCLDWVRPQLHITVNSLSALGEYFTPDFRLWDVKTGVDLLSVSHLRMEDLPTLNLIREFTKVNYNYLPTLGTLSSYRKILEHVDLSYFLLLKAPLGQPQDRQQVLDYTDSLVFLRDLPLELSRKVVIDSCVTDAINWQKTGYGCSANISRLHIWPDGHVTGCPYRQDGGRTASSVREVVDNIEMALQEYDFTNCTIPSCYTSLEQKPTRRLTVLQ